MRNRTWLLTAALVLISGLAVASLRGYPYNSEEDQRFSDLESTNAGGTLASGKVFVGNSSNVVTARTLSGDVTNDNTGVTAIGAGKVTEAMQAVTNASGLHSQRVARATLNCAASGCSVGAHGLGVSLPAKTLITRSYINVVTQFTDSGTCTVAISCEDANNIKTATDITGTAANGWIEGQSTGAASAFIGNIAATCEITATIADGGSCVPANGKAIIFVEYNVVE